MRPAMISYPMIVASAMLFLYWLSRTMLLLRGYDHEIAQVLGDDVALGRRVLSPFW